MTDGAGNEWAAWRVEFTQLWSPLAVESPNFFHDHCVALLEGSESLASAFTSLVPSSVTEESFWCRYLHARRCIVPNELALFVLESDPATFTCEPNDIDFDNWKDSFFSDWELLCKNLSFCPGSTHGSCLPAFQPATFGADICIDVQFLYVIFQNSNMINHPPVLPRLHRLIQLKAHQLLQSLKAYVWLLMSASFRCPRWRHRLPHAKLPFSAMLSHPWRSLHLLVPPHEL